MWTRVTPMKKTDKKVSLKDAVAAIAKMSASDLQAKIECAKTVAELLPYLATKLWRDDCEKGKHEKGDPDAPPIPSETLLAEFLLDCPKDVIEKTRKYIEAAARSEPNRKPEPLVEWPYSGSNTPRSGVYQACLQLAYERVEKDSLEAAARCIQWAWLQELPVWSATPLLIPVARRTEEYRRKLLANKKADGGHGVGTVVVNERLTKRRTGKLPAYTEQHRADIFAVRDSAISAPDPDWLQWPGAWKALVPLVREWQAAQPPRVRVVAHGKRGILPSKLAMFDGSNGDSRSRLFSPARHFIDDTTDMLPGFEMEGMQTPALPLTLYLLGVSNKDSPGVPAPLALRLFVEAILATPLDARGGKTALHNLTARELAQRLWPLRPPRPNEFLAALYKAALALDSPDARIPWEGGLLRAVTMTNAPMHPDDEVRLVVDLPPGMEKGPQVSDMLRIYGVKSGKKYNAMLNLAYWWHEPGRTLAQVKRGRGKKLWVRVNDPKRYRKLNDAELVNLVFPMSSQQSQRYLLSEARKVVKQLEADGELRIVDDKLLPPLNM